MPLFTSELQDLDIRDTGFCKAYNPESCHTSHLDKDGISNGPIQQSSSRVGGQSSWLGVDAPLGLQVFLLRGNIFVLSQKMKQRGDMGKTRLRLELACFSVSAIKLYPNLAVVALRGLDLTNNSL